MSKNKRVIFSFDERSLESLKKLTEQGRFSLMGGMVRFTEVMVRNPETGEERVLVIPTATRTPANWA